MIQNRIPKFFSSEYDTEWNSEVFSLPKVVWNGIPKFSPSKNSSERNSVGFSLLRNGLEWNSEGFTLPRNGLELNSKGFLFRQTGGIPRELPSVPSCSAFRGIIFCQKMATLIHGES
jgi:hypothetical protein